MKKFIILFLILFFGIFLFQGEVLLAADSDIPGLDELEEAPAIGDKIHIIDVSDTSMAADGTDKWISIQNLLDGVTENTDTDVSGNSWVVDEDNLSSDLDTKVPTQQSVKAYVDTKQDTLVSGTNIKTVGGASLLGSGDTGVIGAAYGGTGVANNAASTITITGSYALGITLTNTTSVTFPTAGTLLTTTGSVSSNTGYSTGAQPLEATLTDIADGTIAENLINTANPWADNEVSDTLTIGASSTVANGALDQQIQDIAATAPAPTNNGYVLASDGSNIVLTGTLAMGISPATNQVTECEGFTEDGGADSNTLATDSGESVTVDGYIGMTIYNTTDVSSCTVTDNTGSTWTCDGLSGGTDNLFQDGDAIAFGPGSNQSGGVTYINTSAGTTILHPATAKYSHGYYILDTTAAVKIDPQSDSMTLNFDASGTLTDPGAGDEVDGPTSDNGAYIWFHNISTTESYSWGVNGAFTDGGAN